MSELPTVRALSGIYPISGLMNSPYSMSNDILYRYPLPEAKIPKFHYETLTRKIYDITRRKCEIGLRFGRNNRQEFIFIS